MDVGIRNRLRSQFMHCTLCRLGPLCFSLALLAGCNRDALEVKDKALWLCQRAQLPTPTPAQFLPDDWKMDGHIRSEDITHLRSKAQIDASEAGAFAGLAVSIMEKAVPAGKAILRARAEKTLCEVEGVGFTGNAAVVGIKVARPEGPTTGGLDTLALFASARNDEERLTTARALIEAPSRDAMEPVELSFVKTKNGWRADFGLPEKAARARLQVENLTCLDLIVEEAKSALGKGLFETTEELIGEFDGCRKQYIEAGGMAELTAEYDKELENIKAHVAARTIPVKWTYSSTTNALDDTTTALLVLEAEEENERRFGKFRSTLFLRCKKGLPEAYFTTDGPVQSIYGDWDRSYVRVRLDNGEPRRLRAHESTSGSALFFPDAGRFIDQLKSAKRLLVGWTPHGMTELVTEFDVHGLDEHLDHLKSACGWQTTTESKK